MSQAWPLHLDMRTDSVDSIASGGGSPSRSGSIPLRDGHVPRDAFGRAGSRSSTKIAGGSLAGKESIEASSIRRSRRSRRSFPEASSLIPSDPRARGARRRCRGRRSPLNPTLQRFPAGGPRPANHDPQQLGSARPDPGSSEVGVRYQQLPCRHGGGSSPFLPSRSSLPLPPSSSAGPVSHGRSRHRSDPYPTDQGDGGRLPR